MRAASVVSILLLAAAGCSGGEGDGGGTGGGDDSIAGDPAGGDERIYAPCAPRTASGDVTHVDVEIEFPLPAELAGTCAGDPTRLEGFLALGARSCLMDVDATTVSGCCVDIEADAVYSASLWYRVAGALTLIGEQMKTFEIPSYSDPVVPLSFAGITVDPGSNGQLVEWCAGNI